MTEPNDSAEPSADFDRTGSAEPSVNLTGGSVGQFDEKMGFFTHKSTNVR